MEETPPPAVVPAQPAVVPPTTPKIGLGNSAAIRVAIVTGVAGCVLSALIGPLTPVWLFLVGVLAVYFYRRLTGQSLSMFRGAHLGWISGLMGFLLMGPLMAFTIPRLLQQPDFVTRMRTSMQSMGAASSQIDETINMLRTPAGVAWILIGFFVFFTAIPAFGGALGAKFFSGPTASGEPRQPSA